MRSEPPPASHEAVDDDLLRPSVAATTARRRYGEQPWRLGSQFYVAVCGGAAGVAIIAVLNAARLGLPVATRWAIVGLGVLGVAASALVVSTVGLDDDGTTQTARLLGRVVGVVAWGGMYLLQRGADRVHDYRSREDDPYASLWVPGILAAIAGSLVQLALTVAVLGEVA